VLVSLSRLDKTLLDHVLRRSNARSAKPKQLARLNYAGIAASRDPKLNWTGIQPNE